MILLVTIIDILGSELEMMFVLQWDRSPCGSGVQAKAALEYSKGTLKLGRFNIPIIFQ